MILQFLPSLVLWLKTCFFGLNLANLNPLLLPFDALICVVSVSCFIEQEWLREWRGSVQKWKEHKELRRWPARSHVVAWLTWPRKMEEIRVTRLHGWRDRAAWNSTSDAEAWTTRPRGEAKCRMTRPPEWRVRVTCAICIICRITKVAVRDSGQQLNPVFGPETQIKVRELAETHHAFHNS